MALELADLQQELVWLGVMSPNALSNFLAETPVDSAPELAEKLESAGIITPFQAERLLGGNGSQLALGNYLILEELGAGGMGLVLKAKHLIMQRVVALKVMSKALVDTPAAVERFRREVTAVARLEHPNIVTAYDADEANGVIFLVMQFISGRDLAAVVRERGMLPSTEVLEYVLQAARGLEYAHARGVIHRDIKPANLLLGDDGVIKILDMGLARIVDDQRETPDLTAAGQMLGTVDYMAPEQAVDTRKADQRSDIYSLGATLWYLLTGRPMYAGDTRMKRVMAHMHHPLPSLRAIRPDVSFELEQVFTRMVAKSPEARYQSMTEAIASLAPLHKKTGVSSNLPAAYGTIAASSVARSAQSEGPSVGKLQTPSATLLESARPAPPVEASPTDNSYDHSTLIGARGSPPIAEGASWFPTRALPVRLMGAVAAIFMLWGLWQWRSAVNPSPAPGSDHVETAGGDGTTAPSQTDYRVAFDGVDDYGYTAPVSPGNATAITMEVWASVESLPVGSESHFLVDWGPISLVVGAPHPRSNWMLQLRLGNQRYDLIDSGRTVIAGDTIHLAAVFDHQSIRWYVDGQLLATRSWRELDSSLTQMFDRYAQPHVSLGVPTQEEKAVEGIPLLNGHLDDLRISSVARYSTNFIPRRHFTSDAETLLLLQFDDGTGTRATDESPQHHHATLIGPHWVKSPGESGSQ